MRDVRRRSLARLAVAALTLAFALGACDSAKAPSPTASGGATSRSPHSSSAAEPSSAVVGQLGGPWRRSPIIVDDAHVAIVSDACAAAAREQLDSEAADLPTALVEAQGLGYVIAILADDLDAVECLATLDDTTNVATVGSVDRLSRDAVAPVDGKKLSLASVVYETNGTRTVAFGRVGPDAHAVKIGFDDQSVIFAGSGQGWWATWWQGTVRAATFVSVDKSSIVIASTPSPVGEVEARIDPAPWWTDPAKPAPTDRSTEIHGLVLEKACSSGKSPEGRVDTPRVEYDDTSVTATFEIRRLPGAQDCTGNQPFPVTIELGEPLGKRTLLDGAFIPPRDASKAPDG